MDQPKKKYDDSFFIIHFNREILVFYYNKIPVKGPKNSEDAKHFRKRAKLNNITILTMWQLWKHSLKVILKKPVEESNYPHPPV